MSYPTHAELILYGLILEAIRKNPKDFLGYIRSPDGVIRGFKKHTQNNLFEIVPNIMALVFNSPIERIMFGILINLNLSASISHQVFDFCGGGEFSFVIKKGNKFGIDIMSQFQIDKYFADFMLIVESKNKFIQIVIECDGYEFHEKTKAQAAHDKKRDRIIQSEGYLILHFTGSEIYQNPSQVQYEIENFIIKSMEEA